MRYTRFCDVILCVGKLSSDATTAQVSVANSLVSLVTRAVCVAGVVVAGAGAAAVHFAQIADAGTVLRQVITVATEELRQTRHVTVDFLAQTLVLDETRDLRNDG